MGDRIVRVNGLRGAGCRLLELLEQLLEQCDQLSLEVLRADDFLALEAAERLELQEHDSSKAWSLKATQRLLKIIRDD